MALTGTSRIKKRRDKWQETLKLVQACEDKYGSISKTPVNDITFRKIRRIYAEGQKRQRVDEARKEWIVNNVKKGYQMNRLVKGSKLSVSCIYGILDSEGLQIRSTFRYKLDMNNPNKPLYYFNDLIYSVNNLLYTSCKNSSQVRNLIAKKHWELILLHTGLWKTIPLGSYYMPKGLRHWHRKDSENDYAISDN